MENNDSYFERQDAIVKIEKDKELQRKEKDHLRFIAEI
jgi:hypothetical protein